MPPASSVKTRADPLEDAYDGSGMYVRWYAYNMWLMVPAQKFVGDFFATIKGYPFQAGSSLPGKTSRHSLPAWPPASPLIELQ